MLDSNFGVHGVNNLRVVDASVFSEIPGFFTAVPIYRLGEKATDDILANAGVGIRHVFNGQGGGKTADDVEAAPLPWMLLLLKKRPYMLIILSQVLLTNLESLVQINRVGVIAITIRQTVSLFY